VGVDRIQWNFEPMQRHVQQWRSSRIHDARAKLILYAAFVDGELEAPRSSLLEVHRPVLGETKFPSEDSSNAQICLLRHASEPVLNGNALVHSAPRLQEDVARTFVAELM
jgi:hypothetical protein